MMMKRSLYISILIICYYFVCSTNAFCIYNESEDADYGVRQLGTNSASNLFSRFKRDNMKTGEKACCPYTERDCVSDGKQDTIVYINFQRRIKNIEYPNFTVSVPGGGWVRLAGNGIETSIIEVFNADGTPFDFEFKSAVDVSAFS